MRRTHYRPVYKVVLLQIAAAFSYIHRQLD